MKPNITNIDRAYSDLVRGVGFRGSTQPTLYQLSTINYQLNH
jgi:hypothetical protein